MPATSPWVRLIVEGDDGLSGEEGGQSTSPEIFRVRVRVIVRVRVMVKG